MPLHFIIEAAGAAAVGDALALTDAEAHHAAVVRRVRIGERVSVGDGCGTWLEGDCESVEPRRVVVRILTRREEPEPSPRVVLVQALAKGDRDEMAVQAATELGVDEIMPWQAARSVSRWDAAKASKGVARWEGIAREAAKQAHRAWVPSVAPLTTTAALAKRAGAVRLVVLEPSSPLALTDLELDAGDASDILLVVGPEGGITSEELDSLRGAGAECVRLGSTVLRTSTAGPAALAVVSAALGRW